MPSPPEPKSSAEGKDDLAFRQSEIVLNAFTADEVDDTGFFVEPWQGDVLPKLHPLLPRVVAFMRRMRPITGQSCVTVWNLPQQAPQSFAAFTLSLAPLQYIDSPGFYVRDQKTDLSIYIPQRGTQTHPGQLDKRVYLLTFNTSYKTKDGPLGFVDCLPEGAGLSEILAAIDRKQPIEPPEPLADPPVLPDNRHPHKTGYGETMLEDDRIITKEGVRYLPLSLASQEAQAPRQTLLNWIKAKVKFQGRPLQIYKSPTARKSFLSEESVQRVANRFIKWPSQGPAGPVTLGEKRDQSGYIGISKAARAISVDHHTMWLWTTQGKAPTDRPLDVIKCTASDQFYIRQKDVSDLKKLVPRSGLRRGPRPQLAPS